LQKNNKHNRAADNKKVEVMNTIVNKVSLVGHLGNNPEMRTFDNGNKMAKIRLATNESYRDADGKKVDNTQWHNLVAFGTKADFAEKYLAKGKNIMVDGRLVNRNYEDKDGKKHFITEIQINEIMILDKKEKAA
jgi:single-strand DNA-binding protein